MSAGSGPKKVFIRFLDHGPEEPADLTSDRRQFVVVLTGDILAVPGEIESRIRFVVLGVAVGEFRQEVRRIPTFGQASLRFRQTDREDRRIWPVRA